MFKELYDKTSFMKVAETMKRGTLLNVRDMRQGKRLRNFLPKISNLNSTSCDEDIE